MSWIRWNNATERYEKSDNQGVAWADLTLHNRIHVTGTTVDDKGIFDVGIDFKQVGQPSIACVAILQAIAGNVDAGNHRYTVSFVTALGETEIQGSVSNTVTCDAGHGKVLVTGIPISSDYRVIARKIYRTKLSGPYDFFLLATINDNSTTEYLDNTADSGLGSDWGWYRENTTNKFFTVSGQSVIFLGMKSTCFGSGAISNGVLIGLSNNTATYGVNAGHSLTTGQDNTIIGCQAGSALTSSGYNTIVGFGSSCSATTGFTNNTIVGNYACWQVPSDFTLNTVVGNFVCYDKTVLGGAYNVIIGVNAARKAAAIDGNVIIGYAAGYNIGGGDYSVFIGNYAGYYETGSGKLFIDNTSRASEADARIKALIYGEFNASPASQKVRINGALEVGIAGAYASAGAIRLENNAYIYWRNAANNGDVPFKLNASDYFELGATLSVNGHVVALADASHSWSGRSQIKSPSNGAITLFNADESAYSTLLCSSITVKEALSSRLYFQNTGSRLYQAWIQYNKNDGTAQWYLGNDLANTSVSKFQLSGSDGNEKFAVSQTGQLFERARSNAIGEWTSVTYNAANFSGTGSMTWTVSAGDQVTYKWMEIGKTMFIEAVINYGSVGGTPSTQLLLKIPNGRTSAMDWAGAARVYDPGIGWQSGHLSTANGTTWIGISLNAAGNNWSLSTDSTHVQFFAFFEFQ